MSAIDVTIEPTRYGLNIKERIKGIIKDKRYDIVLIFVITFIVCWAIYLPSDSDYENPEQQKEPVVKVSPPSNQAQVVVMATPDYVAPSE